MDHSTAICPVEDGGVSAAFLPDERQELADSIRENFSQLFETLSRLSDLYGDTVQGSHARAAAAAAKRARLIANRLS